MKYMLYVLDLTAELDFTRIGLPTLDAEMIEMDGNRQGRYCCGLTLGTVA